MKVTTWSDLVDAILLRKVSFLVAFFVIFTFSYAALSWLDLLPEPVSEEEAELEVPDSDFPTLLGSTISLGGIEDTTVEDDVLEEEVPSPLFPDTIIIDSLDRTINVLNPTSREVTDLDAALLYGVVRHPDSATLEREGNVFILGHSSYLPTVLNKNFQAFNGIQNLKFGDTVRLQADKFEYVYRIDKVYRTQAADTTVPIAGASQRLILATCNSFGSKDDRYIVEAELLEIKNI